MSNAYFNRIKWQCRRGMLELDRLLIPFVESKYEVLDEKEKTILERLLMHSDSELYRWLVEGVQPTEPEFKKMITQIIQHAQKTI